MDANDELKSNRKKWWILASWICIGTIGLPIVTLIIQKPFIPSYSDPNFIVEVGPMYYPMTVSFTMLFGAVLGFITAHSISLWKNGNVKSAQVNLLWGGSITSLFFVSSIVDGLLRRTQDASRGIHTDLMEVPALFWSLILLAIGIQLYINRHHNLPPSDL